jgi:hypothetical protein
MIDCLCYSLVVDRVKRRPWWSNRYYIGLEKKCGRNEGI